MIKGRNVAPSKGDDSVISTVRDVKVRDDTVPFSLSAPSQSAPSPAANTKQPKDDDARIAMRKRGEEKKKLLAALRPVSSIVTVAQTPKIEQASVPLFVMDTKPIVARAETPRVKTDIVKKTKKSQDAKIPTKTEKSKFSNNSSKYTDHKRQKMRDREREKRAKLIDKKQGITKQVSHHSLSQRTTTMPIEGPIESLREMGASLATKLARERNVYENAYARM